MTQKEGTNTFKVVLRILKGFNVLTEASRCTAQINQISILNELKPFIHLQKMTDLAPVDILLSRIYI